MSQGITLSLQDRKACHPFPRAAPRWCDHPQLLRNRSSIRCTAGPLTRSSSESGMNRADRGTGRQTEDLCGSITFDRPSGRAFVSPALGARAHLVCRDGRGCTGPARAAAAPETAPNGAVAPPQERSVGHTRYGEMGCFQSGCWEVPLQIQLACTCDWVGDGFQVFSRKKLLQGVDSGPMVPYNCAPTLDARKRGRARRGGGKGLTQPVKRPILMSPTREGAL